MKKALKLLLNLFLGTVIAIFILAACELTFRWLEIGEPIPTFVQDKANPEYLIFNPNISQSIFYNKDEHLLPQIDPFKKRKAPGSLRIFVLGASTAYGFPYSHNTSFTRILERSLEDKLNKRIEVVNLSLTAINSYTLKSLIDDMLDQKPDLVLIYAGHNEFYGVHGIASSYSVVNNALITNLYMQLRKLHLFNWLDNTLNTGSTNESEPSSGLMNKLFSGQLIAKESVTFEKGVEQYRDNLTQIVSSVTKEKIPIFIGRLASNLKDQKPLDFSASGGEDFESMKFFKDANSHLAQDDYDAAYTQFLQAKESDGLRFRAPEAFNEVISNFRDNPMVNIVSTDSVFRLASPEGIPGGELFLEHVHPTIKGYYLMAHTFYHSILTKAQHPKIEGFNDYYKNHSAITTPVDSIYGELLISRLKNQWPFNEDYSPHFDSTSLAYRVAVQRAEKQMSWAATMDLYYKINIKQKNFHQAALVARSLMLEFPLTEQPVVYYLEALQNESAYEEILDFSIKYVQQDQPNFKLITEHVVQVFLLNDDLEQLKDYLKTHKPILGELHSHLSKLVEDRAKALSPEEEKPSR